MQTSPRGFEDLVRDYVLTDDLDLFERAVSAIPDSDSSHVALKQFLLGRQTIETSWDYPKTISLYGKALETLGRTKFPERKGTIIGNWLTKIIEGHSILQKAESAWTFCNFAEGADAYLSASKCFLAAQQVLTSEGGVNGYSDFRDYSTGWGKIALGMHHNVQGSLLLRNERGEESMKEFMDGKVLLLEAEQNFVRINNALGQHDARSSIIEETSWRNQRMLFANLTEVIWKDYAFFEREPPFERLLANLTQVHSKYPSELLTRTSAEELRTHVANIGRLTISEIGDLKTPPLEVRIVFHSEHVLEIEYALRLTVPIDVFTLYVLKILNTDAIPTYTASLESSIRGLEIKRDNCRLRDVTRLILEALANRVGEEKGIILLDSFVILQVSDYTPAIKVSELGQGEYKYMNGLFSEAETLSLQPSDKETPPPVNLFHDFQTIGALARVSQRAAILMVPQMPEWEVKLYSEVLDHSLETKETIEKMLNEIQQAAGNLRAKLLLLRNAVSENASVSQKEIRKLISNNLDIRLGSLRLFDIQQRHNVLKHSGIADVRNFSARADEELHITDQFSRTESQLKRVETLYSTAFNLGQDFLSLIIAVNSDISRRAFNVLNVIMMGSLGLAVTTAILSTPISYTLAVLAVFATSFSGYLYLFYTKRRVTKLSARFS